MYRIIGATIQGGGGPWEMGELWVWTESATLGLQGDDRRFRPCERRPALGMQRILGLREDVPSEIASGTHTGPFGPAHLAGARGAVASELIPVASELLFDELL